jgi:hypothetical protein
MSGLRERPRELLMFRLLLSLIGAVFVGLGLLAVFTEHQLLASSKVRGPPLSLDGLRAVRYGWGTVAFGLMPLGVWARHSRGFVLWALLCFVAAGVLWFASI